MTEEQKGVMIKVVPERDGHRLELQWSVPPESKTYKIFPCSYLRYEKNRKEKKVYAVKCFS